MKNLKIDIEEVKKDIFDIKNIMKKMEINLIQKMKEILKEINAKKMNQIVVFNLIFKLKLILNNY